MKSDWPEFQVSELECQGKLLVQDGNHGEYRPRKLEFCDDGIAFIRAADFSGSTVNFREAEKINSTAFNRIRKGIGRDLDTILSTKGTVGKIAFVPKGSPEFVCSPQTSFWRSLDEAFLLPEFLYYEMQSSFFVNQILSRQGETDMAAYLSLTSQRGMYIRVPHIGTQKEVVKFLSCIDEKIKIDKEINQTLEQMAQAIFKSWFVDFEPVKAKIAALEAGGSEEDALLAAMQAISGKGEAGLTRLLAGQSEQYAELRATAELFPSAMQGSELGEIPEGWEASDFGSVSNCFDRHRIPLSKRQREQRQGSIPYYGATSIMGYVDEPIFDGIYLLLGEDGSVLKEDGSPFTQYIWGKSWVNNHAHVLQGANGVSTEQLYLFIGMQNITAYVTGAVQLKLNQKNMNSIPFIKAPQELNAKFSELVAPMFGMRREITEESDSLTGIRDVLLPRLLSGELSLPDIEGNQLIAEPTLEIE